MRWLRWLFVALIAGCASLPQGMHPVPTQDLITAWEADGYPAGDCRARGHRVRAAVVHDTTELCGGVLWGCYLSHECGGLFASGRCYDIVVLREDRPTGPLLRHELTHWLLDCSGEIVGGDVRHEHPLWKKDGFGPIPTVRFSNDRGAAGGTP